MLARDAGAGDPFGGEREQSSLFGESGRGVRQSRRRPEREPHGPIFREFYHDAKGAIAKLSKLQTGEAIAALWHPEIGDIDLIWGEPGTPEKDYDDGYGLSHIIEKHEKLQREEILDRLQRDPRRVARPHENQESDPTLGRSAQGGRAIGMGRRLHTMPFDAIQKAVYPGKDDRRFRGSPCGEGWNSSTRGGHLHYPAYRRLCEDPRVPGGRFARRAQLLGDGVTKFGEWSRAMLAKFGERIRPHLARLYFEPQKLWKDELGALRLPQIKTPEILKDVADAGGA